MTAGDMVAFLAARLDEDEAYANEPGSWNEYDPGDPGDPARVLREVEAGRQLLSDYEEAKTSEAGTAGVVTEILFMQIINRASVYSAHPGYLPACSA